MTLLHIFRLPAQGPPDAGGGSGTAAVVADPDAAGKTAEAIAAAAAAGKTPEQLAAETAAATAATTAAAEAETKRKADEAAAASKAPEKYALTLPESGRLDTNDLAYIEDVARKAGWTNEEAQAAIAEQDAAIQAQSDRFLAETTQDKDYGGDKLAASQQLAKAAIDRLRPIGHPRREAFLKFLNRGGAGNHIEVVSALADLGKLMAEDTTVGGNSGSGGEPKTLAQKMYPNQAP